VLPAVIAFYTICILLYLVFLSELACNWLFVDVKHLNRGTELNYLCAPGIL
jgi:hypothetical protein